MAKTMNVVVTKIGLAKIMESTIENPLKLTHFAVGDGNGAEIDPNEDMISLVNEKYRDFLNDTYTNENNLTIECVLRANAPITEGFKIFELGIFDKDGDMIAITQTPEQYRPAPSEGVATEWIASVVLQLQSTENVQIEIPQTVFATIDALQRAIDRIEDLENSNTALMKSKVGIDTWFNTNNKHKGIKVLTLGIQTFGLMEAGNFVKISDYPDCYKNSGAVDRGDGTFQIPIMHPDTTLKNIRSDNSRGLGTYETDDIKSHNHEAVTVISSSGEHTHTYNARKDGGEHGLAGGRFNITNGTYNTSKAGAHTHLATTSIKSTGGTETRMKNTAGQWYMLLKINI